MTNPQGHKRGHCRRLAVVNIYVLAFEFEFTGRWQSASEGKRQGPMVPDARGSRLGAGALVGPGCRMAGFQQWRPVAAMGPAQPCGTSLGVAAAGAARRAQQGAWRRAGEWHGHPVERNQTAQGSMRKAGQPGRTHAAAGPLRCLLEIRGWLAARCVGGGGYF